MAGPGGGPGPCSGTLQKTFGGVDQQGRSMGPPMGGNGIRNGPSGGPSLGPGYSGGSGPKPAGGSLGAGSGGNGVSTPGESRKPQPGKGIKNLTIGGAGDGDEASASAHVRKGPLQIFLEIKQRGMKPNVIAYSAALIACEKGARPEQALQLFEKMKERGFQPNVSTYSVVIIACNKADLPDRALELAVEMRRTFTQSAQALHVLQEMQLDWIFKQLDTTSRGDITLEETKAIYMVLSFDDYPPESIFNEFGGICHSLNRDRFGALVKSLQEAVGKTIDDMYAACQ
jgi:pentatricopeptide repeat protein